MTDAQRPRQFIERDDGRVAPSSFEAAQILLTEPRAGLDLLLRQAFFPTQATKIPTYQQAHVHALMDRQLHTISLSTIVCNGESGTMMMANRDKTVVTLRIQDADCRRGFDSNWAAAEMILPFRPAAFPPPATGLTLSKPVETSCGRKSRPGAVMTLNMNHPEWRVRKGGATARVSPRHTRHRAVAWGRGRMFAHDDRAFRGHAA